MTPAIVLAVLLSAGLHATWNTVMKNHADKEAAWWIFGLGICVCALGHSLVMGYDLSAIARVWPLLAASLAGQVCYGCGLIGAYRRGDLSAYYPIIRSTPLVVVVIGMAFLDRTYGPAVLTGIGLVVCGAFLIQFRPGVRMFDNPGALGFAVLALVGTGVYALADAEAVRTVAPPVMFFWIELCLVPVYMVLFRLSGHGAVERRGFGMLVERPLMVAGLGALGYTSYFLILWAFSAGGDVAMVASLRQASIPVSVLLGGMLLRERHLPMRLAASAMLVAGIVILILYG
jgi:drug/metabolite transporter (DMT)-like permease